MLPQPPLNPIPPTHPLKRKQMEDRVQELEQEIAQAETVIAEYRDHLLNFVSPKKPNARPTNWKPAAGAQHFAGGMEALSQALQT